MRVGALLCLDHDGAERWFFLGPDAAGLKLQHDGREILVITARSPLGQGLLGREVGDEVELASMASCSATKCCRSHSAGY